MPAEPITTNDKLTVSNLMLVNFRTSAAQTEVQHLRDRTGVVAVQSCARQIWIGRKQDFSHIGDHISEGQFSTGANAYVEILKLITGVSSSREWDKESAGQNNQGWDTFLKTHPEKYELFGSFRQGIIADSRLILREILSGIKPHTDEIVARTLSGFKPRESVLIITERSRRGNLSGITERLVKTLSNKPHLAKDISLTHPDENITYQNLSDIFGFYMRNMVSKRISALAFDEIGMAFDIFDRVYIDLQMGQYPETDLLMIDTWKNRNRDDNSLTHLRGVLEKDGFSNEIWADLSGRPDVILPERLRSEKDMITVHNQKLLALAEEAFLICANTRLDGSRPSLKHLNAQMELPGLAL